jgi:signal transduction histidine kinase
VSSDYFKDHFDAGSEIAVPINLNGEIIGVINCESSYKNFFRPFHLEILSEVAKVTAERIDQIITERKYRKVQELNYAVLNSTPSSYLLLNTKQEVISFNRISNVAMRFYTGKEIKLRTHFTEYFPVEFKTELENLFDSSLKGKLNKIEKQIHHSKAGELWFRATFAPAKNKIGKPFGVTLIVENITKDKQTEALILKQNERLTKTNEELDKFIYSVSHDLRSPVSSVIGITTLIDLTDNVNELKEYGQLIHGSMQRMDDFIRNVLDYSKNARIHINTEEVDFQELIKNIITDHSYMRETGKIDVRHNIECSSLITDRQRLSIIISNLLSNAIKYHDSSKEEQFIEISTSCDETYFMLSIKDNGLGIKEEHQSNLFEMFYTANSKAQGSGIGLYILSDTVKILGGEVSFTSKYGEGTEFIVKLPKVLAVAETSLD